MAFVHGGKRYANPHQITSELLRLIEGESLFTDGYVPPLEDDKIPAADFNPDDDALDDVEGDDFPPKHDEPGPLLKFLDKIDLAIKKEARPKTGEKGQTGGTAQAPLTLEAEGTNLLLLQDGVRGFVGELDLSLPDDMAKVIALHGRLAISVPEAAEALANACTVKGYPYAIMQTLSFEEDEDNGLADPAVYKNIAVLFDQAKKEVTVFISDEHREIAPADFLIAWHKNPPEGFSGLDVDGHEKDPARMVYAVDTLLNELKEKTTRGSDARRAVSEAIREYRTKGKQLGYTFS